MMPKKIQDPYRVVPAGSESCERCGGNDPEFWVVDVRHGPRGRHRKVTGAFCDICAKETARQLNRDVAAFRPKE